MSFRLGKWSLMFVLAAGVAGPRASAGELVVNGSFESTVNPFHAGDKLSLAAAQPSGWTVGSGGLGFLAAPGTADDLNKYLAVYGPFPTTSPDGGNFVMIDGAKDYRTSISQTIGNLTIGQSYILTFYQAAGQQSGFHGPTTEQWQVTFGGDTRLSTQFSLSEAGVGAWQQQTMTFTATAASQMLKFLAMGTPNGEPPIVFLDGVSMQAAVPEPSSLALAAIGLVGVIGARVRRARRASA